MYHVLRLHQAPTISELRIRFPVDHNHYQVHQELFQSWINIAMEKKVKRLVLDLSTTADIYISSSPLPSLGSSNFISLVSVRLIRAKPQVTSQLVDYFLSNFPLLEALCIDDGANSCLKNLKVYGGPSLKLKHLHLTYNRIKFLEVSAPNLESLMFWQIEMERSLFQSYPIQSAL